MVASLYLHIPFCRTKCAYCSFSSFSGMGEIYGAYIEALESEIDSLAGTFGSSSHLSTIFFGGGTPTILSGEQLSRLLERCFTSFSVDTDCEISIEANPGTVDREKFRQLRAAGFNRLSIGVQSFAARELERLGRTHNPEEAVRAVEAARSSGFENISLDLMYGIPGQNAAAWKDNLDTALALHPHHLSLYQLTLEENTPMMKAYEAGELNMADDDEILIMDEYNQEAATASGLAMYEISNFSIPGAECRHNCNYWHNNEYLAAGAGAVSYVGGKRERRAGDPRQYIRKLLLEGSAVTEGEQLGSEETFRETVIMGLRMCKGVSVNGLRERFGIELLEYYGPVLEKLLNESLVELTSGHLRLTTRGRLLSNAVMAELV